MLYEVITVNRKNVAAGKILNRNTKKLESADIKFIKDLVIKTVEKYSDFDCENTNPGIVFSYNFV